MSANNQNYIKCKNCDLVSKRLRKSCYDCAALYLSSIMANIHQLIISVLHDSVIKIITKNIINYRTEPRYFNAMSLWKQFIRKQNISKM